ncbi:MAG TPA: DNA recombination protein RmuC [Methylibium sp.]|nr:DNA recombination protein RmuC [Methylibium sp.]HEU4460015.1 DNA recombination protein RmuC [Methylibium sp.]
MTWLPWLISAASMVLTAIVLWAVLRSTGDGGVRDQVAATSERLERELRDELARSAQGTRVELGNALGSFQQTLLAQHGETARGQNEQIDSFRKQLGEMQQAMADTLRSTAGSLTQGALAAREAQDAALQRFGLATAEQLRALTESNERRLGEVRTTVEQRLSALAADNEKKLEQMRQTVDEKLHATLEQRLGESFKQVAERLEAVHAGLGEMRKLASDVGSLNRVLTNVKTRGVFGEVQLAGLIEQVFTREQVGTNVETVPGSGARVEFAIKFPGRGAGHDAPPLWLPIDAKFPREDYERLLDAQERADAPAAEAAARAIEQRLRVEARTIREKYIAAPHTTEFGILFVPTEGLYAEALRRPGLVEALQREHRVTLCGPTTLLATLTSLQMGFRTLALEQRSAEVWEVLGAVKVEFGKFGDVLAKTQKKLKEASDTIDLAQTRTRQMQRKLKSVETLDDGRVEALLPGADAAGAGDDDLPPDDLPPAVSPNLARIGRA